MTSAASADSAIAWSSPGYGCIVHAAGAHAGLTFPENRREITEAAIRRAMAHAGFKDVEAFAQRVVSDMGALDIALTELTIGETYFFRDPAQWELVRREIVPELLHHHQDGRGVRAWSAGCASGEEAYTLGIVLREAGCISPMVIGTDLCEHRLARATRAVYTKWSMRGLDTAANRRYFRESGQHFHLQREFCDARFRTLNLIGDDYGQPGQELSELDVILCRNVLIYIDAELLDSIFARMIGALREGGWLMVAASDPQPASTLPVDVVVTNAGLLYRKRTSRSAEPAHFFSAVATPHRWLTPGAPAPIVIPLRPVAVVKSPPAMSDVELATRAYRAADYSRAVELAERIIASERGDASTWVLLVRAHANRGALSEAARCCAVGITRFPDAAELHVVDSAIESQRERFAAAAEAARRAVYLDRTLAVAQLALGTAMLRLGDDAAADRALRAAERMLAERAPTEVVPASDGATAHDLLSTARAHRSLIERRGVHVA